MSHQVVGGQVWGHSGIDMPTRVTRSEQNPETSQVKKPRGQSKSGVCKQAKSESQEVRQRVVSENKAGQEIKQRAKSKSESEGPTKQSGIRLNSVA